VDILTHKIAGLVIRTESNARLSRLRNDPFNQFLTADISPDVHHSVCKVGMDSRSWSPLDRQEQEMLLRCNRFRPDWFEISILKCPQVRQRLSSFAGRFEELELWVGENFIYLIDFSCNRFDIFYTEKYGGHVTEQQSYLPEDYVASNVRQMLSAFLPYFSAMLWHASGVVRCDQAALFLAPNDGGKTTVVRQSNGKPILNDDQVILRKKSDVIVAHGTPFGRMTSGPCQAAVGAFFLLEKAPFFQLEPLPSSEFVRYFWAEHQKYPFFLPKPLKKRTFRILCDICYRTPGYLMRFPKNYVDWDAIDTVMDKKNAVRN
jgi:hypothetical protein